MGFVLVIFCLHKIFKFIQQVWVWAHFFFVILSYFFVSAGHFHQSSKILAKCIKMIPPVHVQKSSTKFKPDIFSFQTIYEDHSKSSSLTKFTSYICSIVHNLIDTDLSIQKQRVFCFFFSECLQEIMEQQKMSKQVLRCQFIRFAL